MSKVLKNRRDNPRPAACIFLASNLEYDTLNLNHFQLSAPVQPLLDPDHPRRSSADRLDVSFYVIEVTRTSAFFCYAVMSGPELTCYLLYTPVQCFIAACQVFSGAYTKPGGKNSKPSFMIHKEVVIKADMDVDLSYLLAVDERDQR